MGFSTPPNSNTCSRANINARSKSAFCVPVDDGDGEERPPDRTVAAEREHLGEARREPRPRRRLGGNASQGDGHVERPGRAPRDDPAASAVGPAREAAVVGAAVVQGSARRTAGDGGVEAEAVDAADGDLASLEGRPIVVRCLVLAKLLLSRIEGGAVSGKVIQKQQ